MSTTVETPSRPAGAETGGRYDAVTIGLHWATAILVVTLFALAEAWDFLPRGTPLRKLFQSWHISLGITLAAVIVVRLLWRSLAGRHLPGEQSWAKRVAAMAAHTALYVLLITQAVLGFVFRWAQGETFSWFGLFSIPEAFPADKVLEAQVADLHNSVAWVIMGIAGIHAAAALWHHYAKHDGILLRMKPGAAS